MAEERKFNRLPITKLIIAEANRTIHALPKPEGQFESQQYLSPTGRTVTKVLIVGTAVETEDIGKEKSLWRMRVVDHSGSIGVMASSYQPEAAQAIAMLQIPAFVAVVGKLNVYQPEENSNIVSIRPDMVKVIDEATYRSLMLDIGLSSIRDIRKHQLIPGIPEKIKEAYTSSTPDDFIQIALQSLESLETNPTDKKENTVEPEKPIEQEPLPEKKEEPEVKKPKPKKDTPKMGKVDMEIQSEIKSVQEVILEIIKKEKKIKKDSLPVKLKARDLNPNMLDWESAVKHLIDDGIIMEPKEGHLSYIG